MGGLLEDCWERGGGQKGEIMKKRVGILEKVKIGRGWGEESQTEWRRKESERSLFERPFVKRAGIPEER